MPWPFGGGWHTGYIGSRSELYAWWPLDEDTFAVEGDLIARDASGHGRTGVYNGSSDFPVRHTAALTSNSTYSVTSSAGRNLRDFGSGDHVLGLTAGSFTFGCWLKGTSTTTLLRLVQRAAGGYNGMAVLLNYPASGDIRFYWDTTGADANSLLATSTGWNDGSGHLLMFEYDELADTISIWVDATEIATRARAGTKPTSLTGTYEWLFMPANAAAGVQCDEYIFFTRTLTSGEHATLAALTL